MTTIKDLVMLKVEHLKAEQKFGHLSCVYATTEYNYMENLSEKFSEKLQEFVSKYPDMSITRFQVPLFTPEALSGSVAQIAEEIISGNYNEECEIHLYTFDYFIDEYVLQGKCEESKRVFDDLFYFMNLDDRIKYLKNRYIDSNMYHNIMMDYIIEVVEN